MTVRVSMLFKSRGWPDTLPFSLCNKKRLIIQQMNRPIFRTKLSIPSYDIGKLFGLRTYQHKRTKNVYNTKFTVWCFWCLQWLGL